MKKKLFTTFAALVFISFGAAAQTTTASSACLNPPPNYGGGSSFQDFGLTPELVQALGLSQAQIDTANANIYGPLNYFANELGNQIADCGDEINTILYGPTTASPQSGAGQVTALAVQLFTLETQLNAKIAAAQAAMMNLLTPVQQVKLQAIVNAIPAAQNTVNLANEATFANLLSEVPPTNAGPPINNTPPALPGVAEMIAHIRAERSLSKAKAIQQSRFVK
jgi:hypothetical protein